MMDVTVRQLINRKGDQVWSIRPSATVFEALELMAEKRIGALLVMQGTLLAGIFSERDYARKVILQGKSSRDTRVSEVMTSNVVGIRPDQTMTDCMALMTDKRVRHLPVLDEDKVVGMISIGDVVKEIISEQEFIIGQLENYITGNR
jgi:CBS domain-containing protein